MLLNGHNGLVSWIMAMQGSVELRKLILGGELHILFAEVVVAKLFTE